MVKKQKIPTLRYTTLCWSACLVITKSFVTRQVCWFMPLILKVLQRESLSSVDEMLKMQENAHRRSTKREKQRKMLVVGRRNAKIAKKHPSSVDEMQESQENARCRSTKRRKRWKTLVVGRRNAGFAENHSSSMDESEKEAKNARHPWMKVEKW